jgi:hypothetical protein
LAERASAHRLENGKTLAARQPLTGSREIQKGHVISPFQIKAIFYDMICQQNRPTQLLAPGVSTVLFA